MIAGRSVVGNAGGKLCKKDRFLAMSLEIELKKELRQTQKC